MPHHPHQIPRKAGAPFPLLDPLGPPAPPAATPPTPLLIAQVSWIALALFLTLPSLSSTRLQTWPHALFAAAFWLIPLLVAAARLALSRPDSRLGGLLDAALGLLALAGLSATAFSPLRATLAPHLLPFLGAIALPYFLLPLLRSPRADRFAAAFVYPTLLVTALRWFVSFPSLTGPYPRNAEPFGHANTTGSVCALAACWLAHLATRATTPATRLLHAAASSAAVALAASSLSRGAVLALALAATVAGGVVLLRRGRLLPFLALAALAFGAAVFSNQRLRELVFSGAWSVSASESNAQRYAMLRGGLALAAERPLAGWGPGAVPHVFPRVRAALPGEPDNYLQLHHTPAQVAATLGIPGLLATALLLFAIGARLRPAPGLEAPPLPPTLAATLACGAALLLFDHSFATPAFALLAALPLAALALRPPASAPSVTSAPSATRPFLLRYSSLVIPAAILVAALAFLPSVARDLAARRAWSGALDAINADAPDAYADHLRRAIALAPADSFYADALASHLATGLPFPRLSAPDPSASIPLLQAALYRNPDLEATHYNLGWLLLPLDPPAARDHFAVAARLAHARAEVYLGLALARLQIPDQADSASVVSALAAEILLDPTFAWSARWRDPGLAPLRPATLTHAADFLAARALAPALVALLRAPGEPVDARSGYRRIRPGHGVLFGHPDGPPPADVNVLLNLTLPPDLLAVLPPKGFVPAPLLHACAGLTP